MGAAAIGSAIGIQLIGSGIQAYAQYKTGQEQADLAEQIGKVNQQLSARAAADALQRGQRDAGVAIMEGRQRAGEVRAAFGASGVDTSTGSPAALLNQMGAMTDFDAETIRNNAAREAYGFRVQGFQAMFQARYAASQARTQSGYAAAGTILGGLGGAGLSAYNAFGRG